MPMKAMPYAAGYLVLCALWLQLAEQFGLGLAGLFVILGSALLVLAVMGHETAQRAVRDSFQSLREGPRDPRDTLTHVLMLAEHSRRNGLLGLGEVETNWSPLRHVCVLVACAADEQRFRLEADSSVRMARHRANHMILPWAFYAIAMLCTGALAATLTAFATAHAGAARIPSYGYLPMLVALCCLAVVVLPILMRLVLARECEANCIQLVFEGGLKILSDNNVDAVFHGLVDSVPGAPAQVKADDIGALETGRGPWL